LYITAGDSSRRGLHVASQVLAEASLVVRRSVCLTDGLFYPQPERLVIVDLMGREIFKRLLIPHLFSSYQLNEVDTMMRYSNQRFYILIFLLLPLSHL